MASWLVPFFIVGEDILVYWAGVNGVNKFLVIGGVLLVWFYRSQIIAGTKLILSKFGI